MIVSTNSLDFPRQKTRWGIQRSRMELMERVLVVIEVLSASRHGMSHAEILADVCERMGTTWSERTVYRSLEMLERMGLASRTRGNRVIGQSRWRWVGRPVLPSAATIDPQQHAQLQEVNALLRDKLREANEVIRQMRQR